MTAISSRKTVTVSQRPRRLRSNALSSARTTSPSTLVLTSDTVRTPPLAQFAGQSHRQVGVEADGRQQEGALDGLVPERVDLQDHERRADRGQQQRAQCGAPDRAGAAED